MPDTVTLSLPEKTALLATRIGTECKTLRAEIQAQAAKVGDLTTLTGTQKTTVVAALNEQIAALKALETEVSELTQIDDTQASASTTYSSSKITSEITAAKQAVKDDLLGGAGTAYDTLKELAELIQTNQDAITALQALAAGHVKYDGAQELTDAQKTQARSNIGAASASDLETVYTRVEANETAIAAKASQADLNAANTKIAANTTAIASKASQADLEALEAKIGDADSADFVATFEAALQATE